MVVAEYTVEFYLHVLVYRHRFDGCNYGGHEF